MRDYCLLVVIVFVFLGHWAARAVLFNFSLWRGVGVGFGFRLYDLLQSKDQLPLCACSD